MKVLAVLLFALVLPAVPTWANGSPCGPPPELTSARADRAIGQAARGDLTATQVDQPFIQRARGNIAALMERFSLPRDQVVAVYVHYVCEELAARDTLPGTLSQAIARLEEGLARDVAEEKSGAPETAKSGRELPISEDVNEAADVAGDQAETQATAETLETGADPAARHTAAVEQQARAAQHARTPESEAVQSGEPQTSAAVESAKRAEPGSAPAQARQPASKSSAKSRMRNAARITQQGYGRAPVAKQGQRIGHGYAAPNGNAGPSSNPSSNRVQSFAFRPPVSASPGSGRAAPPAAPQPQAAPAPAQPAPDAVIDAPRRAEQAAPSPQPAPQVSEGRAPASTRSRPETAAAPPESAEAPPQAESAPGDVSATEDARDMGPGDQPAEAAQPESASAPDAVADAAPEPQGEAAEQPGDEAAAPTEPETEAAQASRAAQPEPQVAASADADGACPERGVLGPECFDVDAALERLRDRPVEYNHPEQMIKGQATEITLVLRTDFTAEGLPEEASTAFESLQGEVKQQRAKIANIMSARLRGREFEVDPAGMQERTVTWRRPVQWSWYVTPKEGGENKRLELQLYAHIVNPQGEMQPPVLIKTLDATIDVDVRTLDWLVEQARTFEPIYAIAAAIIGLFTAMFTLWLRRRPPHPGNGGPPSGITATEAPSDRRISDMSASEAAAAAARKGQDDDDGGGSQTGSRT